MAPKPLVATFFCLLLTAGPALAVIETQEQLNTVVGSFYKDLSIDDANIYDIKNYTLTKDIGVFKLESGTLYLTKPVSGLVTTAVFIGKGTATIKPTRPMDRKCLDLAADQHLKKKPGGEIATSFGEMVMVSFDGSLDEMRKALTVKGVATSAPQASKLLEDRLHVWKASESSWDLAVSQHVAGLRVGPLRVEFNSSDYGWLVFAYSPRSQYEVSLGTREKIGMFYDYHPLVETHKASDFDPAGNYIADPVADQKAHIDVKSYKMEITIPDTNHFLVEAAVTFSPLVDDLPVVEFDLVNNILGARTTEKAKPVYLNKVTDDAGKGLPFVHLKDSAHVFPAQPLKKGQDYTYHFSLDEQTIIQLSSVHYLVLNTYPWFPQHGYNGGQYAMDWTIKAKKPLIATGSGRVVEERSEGSYNVTHLVFDKDVQFPSLIFGQYQKLADVYNAPKGGTSVDLAVFSSPKAAYTITDVDTVLILTQGKQRTPLTYELIVPSTKPRNIATEAKEILKFCEDLFGPFPYQNLTIAQMAPFMGFGQSPPGFVQLTGEAFMNPAAEVLVGDIPLDFSALKLDYFHEFFAHEIAHQWFAHSIVWASDEDVWLSEAFAEYTAGLYVMQYLGKERFQGKLKEWRDAARLADPYAPIAWATNLSGQTQAPQANRLIYSKGPYVVHMLRMQLGHEKFTTAIRNTITKYRHKPITTDHLRAELEAVAGYKLDFFFNQWYRDTGIPTFDYSSSVEQTPDGKWLASVKISQRDKNNVKIVSMPVFFHFGKDKVVVKDRPVLKADDLYQIKLPEKPLRITLDDYKTLLADIVEQSPTGH